MADLINIDTIARRIVLDQAAEQERALEQALQGGQHGVSTIHHGLRTVSRVDPLVPYGHQFTFPSRESYENWIQNGAPTT